MRKTLLILGLACWAASAQADEKSLMDEKFVVETSEEDIDDSLNRVSGHIDRGFASEEQTYVAKHQGRTGPFGSKDDEDSYISRNSY